MNVEPLPLPGFPQQFWLTILVAESALLSAPPLRVLRAGARKRVMASSTPAEQP